MPAQQMWELARVWYEDRLAPEWKRKSRAEYQRLLEEVGLTGPFWRLG